MNYLIAYDISDNKNRKKLGELLETYGQRVNYSVFEIQINKTKLNKLIKEIEEKKYYNKIQDSLRFYHICQNCILKSFELSDRANVFEQKELFI